MGPPAHSLHLYAYMCCTLTPSTDKTQCLGSQWEQAACLLPTCRKATQESLLTGLLVDGAD